MSLKGPVVAGNNGTRREEGKKEFTRSPGVVFLLLLWLRLAQTVEMIAVPRKMGKQTHWITGAAVMLMPFLLSSSSSLQLAAIGRWVSFCNSGCLDMFDGS